MRESEEEEGKTKERKKTIQVNMDLPARKDEKERENERVSEEERESERLRSRTQNEKEGEKEKVTDEIKKARNDGIVIEGKHRHTHAQVFSNFHYYYLLQPPQAPQALPKRYTALPHSPPQHHSLSISLQAMVEMGYTIILLVLLVSRLAYRKWLGIRLGIFGI